MGKIKLVRVVFKTHLDIGFTDLAANVTERYLRDFIPAAIKTAASLRNRGGAERLVWTTGSWLIYKFFQEADEQRRQDLAEAIEKGDIAWHALPFTTHTELMNVRLFDYGLSLSAALDARFDKKTIAAKMTDVPGHTIGMVPLLARRGVKYLHIGVNGGSPLPDVPRVFRWQAPEGSEIIVQYDESYGDTLCLPGMEEALVVVNGSDNSGPPGTEMVLKTFREIAEKFPAAEIRASTLDDFVPVLQEAAHSLPVVTEEIGDTWIHGIAADPAKTARFRELLRLGEAWGKTGRLREDSDEFRRFYDNLLMIPEHTWGLDVKKYLADYTHWTDEDFQKARSRDKVVIPQEPSEFGYFYSHAMEELKNLYPHNPELRERQSYSFFESSHLEQRAYLDAAVAALPEDLRDEAEGAFRSLETQNSSGPAVMAAGRALHAGESFPLGRWQAVIGDSGALVSFREEGREYAGEGGIGAYSYQTFSYEDYVQYHQDYNRNLEQNGFWVIPDFGKPGMQYARPRARSAFFGYCITGIERCRDDSGDRVLVSLEAPSETPRGAPRLVRILYMAPRETNRLEIRLTWHDKKASRLPEALWFSICLHTATPARWRFSKLGSLINPLDVASRGNRSYHCAEYAGYLGTDRRYRVTPLDTPLAALGERKMLRFDNRFADPAGGIHFNLYNSIWGTNFPLWYEEDGTSRFIIEIA